MAELDVVFGFCTGHEVGLLVGGGVKSSVLRLDMTRCRVSGDHGNSVSVWNVKYWSYGFYMFMYIDTVKSCLDLLVF